MLGGNRFESGIIKLYSASEQSYLNLAPDIGSIPFCQFSDSYCLIFFTK